MELNTINILIVLVIGLMVAVTIWGWDLHELFIKEKRANRVRIIRAEVRNITQKLTGLLRKFSELFGQIVPYILILLKWLLRMAIKVHRIISGILKWLFAKMKELFQFTEDRNQKIPPELLLMPEENLEIPKVLEGHPYSSPVLENVYFDHFFAVSYVISAAGIVRQYKDTATEELEPIIINTIRNFFATKRKVKAYVYIIAATPKYLHFAVTYTPYGWNRLLQIYPPLEDNRQQTPPPVLEETIPDEDSIGEGNGENEDSEPW